MADSIKSQILDNIVTTLQGVTAANGYNRTIRAVSRSAKSLMEAARDMVFVGASRVEYPTSLEPNSSALLTVMLDCVAEDMDNLPKAVDDLASDVVKALGVDVTRGTLAIDTNVISIEELIMEDLEPMGACLVEVQVKFRHEWGDPYTAA